LIHDSATAAEVQAAFMSVPSIGYAAGTAPGYDNVRVTGNPGGPYTVTFIGQLAGVNVNPLTPTGASDGVVQNGGAAVAYSGNPDVDQAAMSDQPHAVVVSDGYAVGYRETNGVGPAPRNGTVVGGGLLNLSKVLPGAYRGNMSALQKLAYLPAQTGIQLHATCSGVPALEEPDNVWQAWQRSDNDPFYNYIPWQATKAGLGDDPAKWIAVVKSVTGVDLSAVTNFASACQGLGGTYHPADTASNVTSAAVADATTPLNTQIGALTAQVGSLVPQLATLKTENTALKAAAQAVPARKLALTLASSKLAPSAITTMVTGTAGAPVSVRVQVSQAVAKALRLKSATLASKAARLNAQGAALISLRVSERTVKTLKKTKGTGAVTVAVASGSETSSSPARLTL